MKVMVTGGGGFIGGHLLKALRERGDKVLSVDLDTRKQPAEYCQDITTSRFRRIVKEEKPEVIHHLAASLEITRSIANPMKEATNNVLGTVNVLEAARDVGAKVVYASSGAVYGRTDLLPSSEDDPPQPHWPYGVSKLAGEQYVEQYRRFYGLKAISFRYSIVYGDGEWFGRAHTMFIKRSLEGKPLIVFGDGRQTRDYIHVSDVVQAHLDCDGREGVYNLGSGKETTIHRVAEMVGGEIVFRETAEGESAPEQPERVRLEGELRRFCLDPAKAKAAFWKGSTVKLEDGLASERKWAERHLKEWGVPRI
jgi:UDP-glucose 4-epimerase